MRIAALCLAGVCMAMVFGCVGSARQSLIEASPNYSEGEFVNSEPFSGQSIGETIKIFTAFIFAERHNTVPSGPIPVETINPSDLQGMDKDQTTVYRLGHSTILMSLEGEYWITDPIFSERASLVQWAGPKRFHRPPIDIESLPTLKGVIISHDHYDHLDAASIKKLSNRVEAFYVPLGVGQRLIDWDIPTEKIYEFDWWQELKVGSIKLVNTPANHFSGRGLFDRNETLWSSWVIETPSYNLFFSGDSGYFKGFKEIGERYGPFDLTMMENGAYASMWQHVHMTPAESVQAHIDLKGQVMLPIHNGTFDLAYHEWTDPFEQVQVLAKEKDIVVATPQMGMRWQLNDTVPQVAWWRDVVPDVLDSNTSD